MWNPTRFYLVTCTEGLLHVIEAANQLTECSSRFSDVHRCFEGPHEQPMFEWEQVFFQYLGYGLPGRWHHRALPVMEMSRLQ